VHEEAAPILDDRSCRVHMRCGRLSTGKSMLGAERCKRQLRMSRAPAHVKLNEQRAAGPPK
jgi:hypothetical protein